MNSDIKCGCGGTVRVYGINCSNCGIRSKFQNYHPVLICQKCHIRSYVDNKQNTDIKSLQDFLRLHQTASAEIQVLTKALHLACNRLYLERIEQFLPDQFNITEQSYYNWFINRAKYQLTRDKDIQIDQR